MDKKFIICIILYRKVWVSSLASFCHSCWVAWINSPLQARIQDSFLFPGFMTCLYSTDMFVFNRLVCIQPNWLSRHLENSCSAWWLISDYGERTILLMIRAIQDGRKWWWGVQNLSMMMKNNLWWGGQHLSMVGRSNLPHLRRFCPSSYSKKALTEISFKFMFYLSLIWIRLSVNNFWSVPIIEREDEIIISNFNCPFWMAIELGRPFLWGPVVDLKSKISQEVVCNSFGIVYNPFFVSRILSISEWSLVYGMRDTPPCRCSCPGA